MNLYKIKDMAQIKEPEIQTEKTFEYIGSAYIITFESFPDQDAIELIADDNVSERADAAKMAREVWGGASDYTPSQTKAILSLDVEGFERAVKSHVSKLILAHASEGTQMNMTAAAASGALSDDQLAAYRECVAWVDSVRAKGKEIVKNKIYDYTNGDHWPETSDAAISLAAQF